MKIETCSSIPITALINALVTNDGGVEYLIGGIGFSLDSASIVVELLDPETRTPVAAVDWNDMREEAWSIQLTCR